MPAPQHPREEDRLASLRSCGIVGTPSEARFDRLVYMAAQILAMPMSMVTFVENDRQWFKAVVGIGIKELPLDHGFCPFAILEADMLIVEDASADRRFATNPVVIGPPFVRFFAGIPIGISPGLPLGTLCVVDIKPRLLRPAEIRALRMLAAEAEQFLLDAAGQPTWW